MGLLDRIFGRFLGPVADKAVERAVKKDAMSAFQGVPAYWFARAIEVGGQETLFEPYRNSVWVMRAIKKVAGPVASVQLVFLTGSAGESSALKGLRKNVWTKRILNPVRKATEDDFVELPDIAEWLEEPAPGLAWSDFVEATVGWLKLKGEAFWVLSDEMLMPFPEMRQGNIPPIIVARPDRMRHLVEGGQLVGWVFTDAGGKTFHLLPEQVIQTKFWNPYDSWRGLAEYEAAQIASEGDWLAGKFSRNLMANNGDTGPFIVAKNGVPTEPQREQIIQDLKAKRQAQLRGDFRPIFMTGDVTVEDPQVRTVDGDYIAQRLASRHEIAAAFGVPMSMFDVKNDYSMGSQSAYYQLILDTCIPTGAKLCDGLERLVQKLKGERYEIGLLWDEHPVMQAVTRERIDAMDKLANRGMPMRAVSVYLHLDLPDFEGDDVGLIPMNLVPIAGIEEEPEPTKNPALGEGQDGKDEQDDILGADADEPKAVKEMLGALRGGNPMKAMARARSKKLWEQHMRQRSATMKVFESKVSRVLNEYRAKTLRELAHHGSSIKGAGNAVEKAFVTKGLIDLIFNPSDFGKQLSLSLNPAMHEALQTAAEHLLKDELGKTDPWKFPPQKALDYVKSRDKEVQGCGETVRNQLNTSLSDGIEKGDSIEQLSDRVRSVFNALAKGEAKRIALTETGMAFNFSRHEAMTSAGVKLKRWLSSHGPTVRPAHAEAEATGAVPIDEPFIVDGEELMYPGDPSGSPENVINCHCIQLAAVE